MCMKGAIGLINSLHENVHIRGCIDAYWPNCVSKKKDTIQQSSAGVPISLLSKPDSGYEPLYNAINSIPHSSLKKQYAAGTKTIPQSLSSPSSKDVATEEPQTEP